MELGSFYGGRRGASFVIVKSYKTIAEMIFAFKQGGNYQVVNYDEFVIIDTENKNDKDNGKVYRRGYEYNDSMGGAVYVGQIVGPAGMAPHTEMKTIKEVEELAEREGFTYRRGSGSYAPSENLIPGKYTDQGIIKYNDEIEWAYCSVRDANSHESTAHIGFKFPYMVVEYEADSVDAYYNRTDDTADFKNTNLITRIDNGEHPFYEKWGIKIPKGIKGDCLRNLRVMIADNTIEAYEGKADDVSNRRVVVVYDMWVYDKVKTGEKKTFYVGPYNMIDNISISDTGFIRIDFTHDDDYTTQLHIPTNVTINTGSTEGAGTQKVVVTYGDGVTKEIGNPLNYIIKTACNKDTGWHLYVLYSDPVKRNAGPKVTYEGRADWTDLGYIGNGELGAIAAKESDTAAQALIRELPPYSAWLIIEE